jgi:hypothetical protein
MYGWLPQINATIALTPAAIVLGRSDNVRVTVEATKDPPPLSGGGFGTEVRAQWTHASIASSNAASPAGPAETGLAYQPLAEGDPITGMYRQRVTLSSGRFAMMGSALSSCRGVPRSNSISKDKSRAS